MTAVCEQCGATIGLRFLEVRLVWVHVLAGDAGTIVQRDHQAIPAPELPLHEVPPPWRYEAELEPDDDAG